LQVENSLFLLLCFVSGAVYLGEEEAWGGGLIHVYKYLMGGAQRMEPGSSQGCPVKRREATGTNRNMGNSI